MELFGPVIIFDDLFLWDFATLVMSDFGTVIGNFSNLMVDASVEILIINLRKRVKVTGGFWIVTIYQPVMLWPPQ
jgi:hypothetical protein